MPQLSSSAALAAVGMLSTSALATATSEPGPSLWELTNRTAHPSSDILLLAETTQIISFCGVDLVGGDIWTARHPNPDACVTNCLAENGCDAATWTKFEGGTCWFKRLDGSWASSVPSVGAVSFLRVPASMAGVRGPSFPANVDMPGNDLQVSQVDSPLECTIVCNLNPFCFAVTWTTYQGGSCYLKNKAAPYVTAPGSTSQYSGRLANPDTCLVHL